MPAVPGTMKAVLLKGHGGFDQLEFREDVPVPQPEEGAVLVQIGAAGVNNTDINTRTGWYSRAVSEERPRREPRSGSTARAPRTPGGPVRNINSRGFRAPMAAAGSSRSAAA